MPDREEIVSKPCFLVGAERSGTTMLRLMLDHHPKIVFRGEYEFMVDFLPPDGWPDMEEYTEYLRTNRVFNHWNLETDSSLAYPDLMRSFLLQGTEEQSFEVIGATVHQEFDQLPRIWPEARYIHMVRDPRDVAMSAVQMGWAGNVWAGAQFWIDAEETWGRLSERLHHGQWTQVRFVDLVTNPHAELERLCNFLGVPYDDRMLDYSRDTSYTPPDPRIAFKWKRKYPVGGASLVEQRAGALIQRAGYELSATPGPEPGFIGLCRLRLDNKLGKIKHAARRYGWRLYVTDLIARKLKLRPLAERCRNAKWAIDEAHLK